MNKTCPRCDSPQAHLHPAIQHEGEVNICPDPFHGATSPPNAEAVAAHLPSVEAIFSEATSPEADDSHITAAIDGLEVVLAQVCQQGGITHPLTVEAHLRGVIQILLAHSVKAPQREVPYVAKLEELLEALTDAAGRGDASEIGDACENLRDYFGEPKRLREVPRELSRKEYIEAVCGPLRVAADLCDRNDYKSCAASLRSVAEDITTGRLVDAALLPEAQAEPVRKAKCVCSMGKAVNFPICQKPFVAARRGHTGEAVDFCANSVMNGSNCNHSRACHASGDSAQSMKDG